jgi:SAM-dependent methyltransferase
VAGYHDIRLDGMLDILLRCRGASVLDVGCNRGLVGFELANNGATVVHGCDIYEEGIATARGLFIDLRSVESKFEVVDLTGPGALGMAFGDSRYDIVVMLATMHKLKRVMTAEAMSLLLRDLGGRTKKYFCWRATSDKPDENWAEMKWLDKELSLKRIHTSSISESLGICAIWRRDG